MLLLIILVAAGLTAAPAGGAMHGQGVESSTSSTAARLLLQANQGEAQDTSATETPVEQQYHRQYPGGGHHHAPKHAADVCIIGAGASGIASALRLRQKGYKDVVILERNTFPGGKAVTLKVEPNNTSLYVAALVGFPATYANIMKLLDTYKVPTFTFQSDNYLFSKTGLIIPTASLAANQTTVLAVLAAFAKYSELYVGLKKYLVPGYTRGVPAELQMSFGAWLRASGLEALIPFGFFVGTGYGYGSLESIPAAYALTGLTPEVIDVVFGGVTAIYTDFEGLWRRAAADLAGSGVRVNYGVNITEVKQRHGDLSSKITYTSASEKTATTQRCKRIIAAFPPIQASLAPFDLDSQQREVLDRVRFVQYISGVINMPNATVTERFGVNTRMLALTGDRANPLGLTEPPGGGLPMMFLRQPNTSVATFYSWIAGNTSVPDSTLAQQTVAAMSLFNRPPGSPVEDATPLTPADLSKLERWVNFAHFDVSAISSGVLAKLEALQGHRGTFFTSSLRTFETMEAAVVSAYDIVDRYF